MPYEISMHSTVAQVFILLHRHLLIYNEISRLHRLQVLKYPIGQRLESKRFHRHAYPCPRAL